MLWGSASIDAYKNAEYAPFIVCVHRIVSQSGVPSWLRSTNPNRDMSPAKKNGLIVDIWTDIFGGMFGGFLQVSSKGVP